MPCKGTIDRVNAICAELMDIIDAAREGCDKDECELVNCVVHDCVQKMRRVLADWEPRDPVDVDPHSPGASEKLDRRVN